MIRPARPDDHAGLMAVAAAIGLFPPEGLGEIDDMIRSFFAGTLGEGHVWIADEDAGALVGLAYVAPERMTSGTWNIYLIGVLPNHQRQGHGAALLRYIEHDLANRGERVLLVETSGFPSFAATRAFYRANGYDEEARIREFYQAGEDKIVFRKALGIIA